MFLIVGLGNPGNIYEKTRHNAGFMAVDLISNRHNFSWCHKSKFNADIATGTINGEKIILCKPTTFMNLSGKSILPLMSFYKIEQRNIIVIHDDIDLDLGKLKCKIGGSAAGHNGLKSIDNIIGSDYTRIRIGVGKPDRQHINTSDYVLSKFKCSEVDHLLQKNELINKNIELLLSHQIEKFRESVRD